MKTHMLGCITSLLLLVFFLPGPVGSTPAERLDWKKYESDSSLFCNSQSYFVTDDKVVGVNDFHIVKIEIRAEQVVSSTFDVRSLYTRSASRISVSDSRLTSGWNARGLLPLLVRDGVLYMRDNSSLNIVSYSTSSDDFRVFEFVDLIPPAHDIASRQRLKLPGSKGQYINTFTFEDTEASEIWRDNVLGERRNFQRLSSAFPYLVSASRLDGQTEVRALHAFDLTEPLAYTFSENVVAVFLDIDGEVISKFILENGTLRYLVRNDHDWTTKGELLGVESIVDVLEVTENNGEYIILTVQHIEENHYSLYKSRSISELPGDGLLDVELIGISSQLTLPLRFNGFFYGPEQVWVNSQLTFEHLAISALEDRAPNKGEEGTLLAISERKKEWIIDSGKGLYLEQVVGKGGLFEEVKMWQLC